MPRDAQKDLYQDAARSPPSTHPDTPENGAGKPSWVINQRNSRHESDYGYMVPVTE